MTRFAQAFLFTAALGSILSAQAQQTPAAAAQTTPDSKADAYYNFAMGRLYAELASNQGGQKEYIAKAIQHYQDALKADPTSPIIFEELTDLLVQTGRLRDAVTQAEELLAKDPENLDARRTLGRIYTRMAGDNQTGRVDQQQLQNAITQFEKVTAKDPKDAESWVMLGKLYRFSSKSPEAEKAYNAAIAADPSNEEALGGLALLYADLGDSKRAIEKLKAVTDKNPNPRALAALADQYRELHDYKSAAEVLKKALEMAPEDTKTAWDLGQALLESDQADEALKLFEGLAAAEPTDPRIPLRIAEIYRTKHDIAKAREALAKAKAIDAQSLNVRYEEVKLLEAEGKNDQAMAALKAMLDDTARRSYNEAEGRIRASMLEEYGILSRGAENWPQALDAFKQMAALGGDNAMRAAVQTIDTYRQSHDSAAALREADAALKKYPTERMIKVEHATVLADMGKTDEAAAELRGLLSGTRDRDTYVALAQIYEKGKRWNEMAKALDDAEKLSTSDEDKETIHFMRGAMLERQKKFDAAEAEFRKVLSLNAENAGALNYLGYMLADRNVRLDDAAQMIRKAVDLEPENGAYLDSLGWVYFRQGNLADAETALLRAVNRMSKDATVHDHLGDVYLKLGKTKEAIAQWQSSLQVYKGAAAGETDPEEIAKVTKKLESARVRLAQETKKQR